MDWLQKKEELKLLRNCAPVFKQQQEYRTFSNQSVQEETWKADTCDVSNFILVLQCFHLESQG